MSKPTTEQIAADCGMNIGCASLLSTLLAEALTDRFDPDFDFPKSRYWICKVVLLLYRGLEVRALDSEQHRLKIKSILNLVEAQVQTLRERVIELDTENARLKKTIAETGVDTVTAARTRLAKLKRIKQAFRELMTQTYETACSENCNPFLINKLDEVIQKLNQLDLK